MPQYKIEVSFSTDRPLTTDELALIEGAVLAQVEEPVDADGDNLDVSVSEAKSKAAREDKYARVAWTADDILALRPDWSEERAEEWLAQAVHPRPLRRTRMGSHRDPPRGLMRPQPDAQPSSLKKSALARY